MHSSTIKSIFVLLSFYLLPVFAGRATTTPTDSLLKVLDRVIVDRTGYAQAKENTIRELKHRKMSRRDLAEIFQLNSEIIDAYESFVCDSAEVYLQENLRIAQELNDQDLLRTTQLRLSYVYSLSGLFLQASELFDELAYDRLPPNYQAWFCWNRIRYYENLIVYTDDTHFSQQYEQEMDACRDQVMALLAPESDEYKKEYVTKLQQAGRYDEAIALLIPFFGKQQPGTHGFAMAAMGMARAYKLARQDERETYYLALAAITDLQLAVKENEALLSLAIKLYENNDIDRAYTYTKVALDDALFYNARFKNAVIARIQPIIEETYLHKIAQQQHNLRLYSILISLFVVVLVVALLFIYRQMKAIAKARKALREMNDKLLKLNGRLDEANIVKEKYIGYFMNQCAVYINRLDEYRKTVNRKIKTGQVESLIQSSSTELAKEVDELFANFDQAFLTLFPNFIDAFNALLKPDEDYHPEKGHLNTELRIFALIRLGVTDVTQIAVFLRYSVQTIYNYKSRVKGKAVIDSNLFEDEIKKIGPSYD